MHLEFNLPSCPARQTLIVSRPSVTASTVLCAACRMPRKAAILSGRVDTEKGSANAYVVFAAAETAEAALAANMSVVEGHHMRVDRAAAPASKTGTTGEAKGQGLRCYRVEQG